ncbi:unnamed protein product [Spirodela intermedia]|uniref:4-coumarate--CoA ligase n=1 Tax=Spirodela intermedia TaxID=51605 RepID=A0A7I8JEW6_SPIIN|nr:unnamed protein product [Spirodela intermedia]CAA6668083.1 unnamed protein product [Spirodela intermedia]
MSSYSRGHICQCLSRILARRRDEALTICSESGARRTGGMFVEGVLRLARGLVALGVRRGDVVAIAAYNSEWFIEWLLAVALVGGVAAPLNYRWLGDGSVPSIRWCVLMGESPRCLNGHDNGLDQYIIKKPVEDPSFDYIWAPEDIALICFTSGTTGKPKGVAISHMSLIIQSYAKIAIVGYTEDDIYLHTAPLCHIGGISSCITMLMVGGCHVFQPKFDANVSVRSIEEHQVTSLITVPTMVAVLASFIGKENEWAGAKSVRKVLNGGGGLSHDLICAAVRMFPCAKLISAYGMTEACSSLTFKTLHDPISPKVGTASHKSYIATPGSPAHRVRGVCVGKPPLHVELCIRGSSTDNCGPEVGSILSRGAHLMVQYWSRVNVETLDRRTSGWLDTGDTGWIDGDGELWLVGRTNGRIKCGGENVYPEEVEGVLLQHPGVSSVVVFGIPDAHFTERIAACVCVKEGWNWVDDGSAPSRERNQLSSHILQIQIPKIYMQWEKPFPCTTSGKLKREEVRSKVISDLRSLHSSL